MTGFGLASTNPEGGIDLEALMLQALTPVRRAWIEAAEKYCFEQLGYRDVLAVERRLEATIEE